MEIHRESGTVRCREADRNGNYKLAAWFDLIQEAAANHAEKLGVGFGALHALGKLWVLSRLRLEIRQTPRLGEPLCVETWPNGVERLFARRQFRVLDPAGTELAVASSAWLLLSAATLRPLKMSELPIPLPENRELPNYFSLGQKIPGENLPGDFPLEVRFSQEDVNGHLNNAEYAGLVQDYAGKMLGEVPLFRTVEIHYLNAVRVPERLILGGRRDGDDFHIEGTTAGGILSFVARAGL